MAESDNELFCSYELSRSISIIFFINSFIFNKSFFWSSWESLFLIIVNCAFKQSIFWLLYLARLGFTSSGWFNVSLGYTTLLILILLNSFSPSEFILLKYWFLSFSFVSSNVVLFWSKDSPSESL